MNDAKDTLQGQYVTATLVIAGKAQEVIVRMVNGEPVIVNEAMLAFERRWPENTDFHPADLTPPATEAVTKKEATSTRIRFIDADLGKYVGDPKRIMANGCIDSDKLQYLKAHPAESSILHRLAVVMGGDWGIIARLIPNHHANGK